MDNLTHGLTGVMLSRAGLNRFTPGATPLLVVASNLPDADIVTRVAGSLPYLDYHRHLSHALVMVPLVALLSTLLVGAVYRRRGFQWRNAWLIAMAGVLAHLGMDLWNNYGIRLLLPFSGRWFALDSVMVVDPWILAVLGLALAAPLLSRLVGSEIGGSRPQTPGRGWAIFALLFLVLWSGWRSYLHRQALATLEARTYQNEAPLRIAAWPTPFNPFLWTGYVSTERAWSLHEIHLGAAFDPEAGQVYFKPEAAAAIRAAQQTTEMQRFLAFAQYPVWRILPSPDGDGAVSVEAVDVRFGLPEEGRFAARVLLDRDLRVVSSRFEFGDLMKNRLR